MRKEPLKIEKRRAPFSRWRGSASVKRVVFSTKDGKPVLLTKTNNGFYAQGVYVGSVHWKDGKRQRVAIKRFRRYMSPQTVDRYSTTIGDLARAGVKLPKMGMVVLPAGTVIGGKIIKGRKIGGEVLKEPEAVQVSQLWGSSKRGSKMSTGGWDKTWSMFYDKAARHEAVGELAKVCNAGYVPSSDLLEPLYKTRHALPMDIDEVVKGNGANHVAGELVDAMVGMSKACEWKPKEFTYESRFKEFLAMVETAKKHANPEVRGALEAHLNESRLRAIRNRMEAEDTSEK